MRKALTLLPPALLIPFALAAQGPLTVHGFHLGMTRDAVKEIYAGFVSTQAATHVSIESESYRDLIMLDNEFSSMGNKVELSYDENEIVNGITFQYKTVDILFEAAGEEAEAFVGRFCQEYGLPGMQMDDEGFVTLWTFSDEAEGYQVSIDSMKNLRIQKAEASGSSG